MNNLKKIRKSKGIYQEEVAKFLNVARNTYSRYERDIHKMDPDTLIKLSKYFNISVDYIIGNIDEPVTLDEIRFMKGIGRSNMSDNEIMNQYNLVDDEGKPATKKDIKEILNMLRKFEGE